MITVYPRGRVYHCAYVSPVTGRRVCKSTRVYKPHIELAQSVASKAWLREQLIAMGEIDAAEAKARERGKALIATVRDEHLATVKSKAHRAERRGVLIAFCEYANAVTAGDFSIDGIADKLDAWLLKHKLRVQSINKKRAHVQAFSDWLKRKKYIATDHTTAVDVVDRDGGTQRPHRAFSPTEARALMDLNVLWRFRIMTGLRGTETSKIERRDLDLSDKPTLHVRKEVAKNKLEAWVPLADSLAKALIEVEHVNPNARVFADRDLQDDLASLGLSDPLLNERSFRKTFVSYLEAAGVELGHRIKLRRDTGREKLTLWVYSDWAIVMPTLRAAVAQMERWFDAQLQREAVSA